MKKSALFAFIFLAATTTAISAIKVSIASGNWSNGAIWFPAGAPVAGDIVTIQTAHSVTCNANPTNCFSLTVNGTATAGNVSMSITGSLVVNGGITFNSTAGVKTFQSVTMGSGSTWTDVQGETFNITADFTMQGGSINGNAIGRFNIGGNWNVASGTNNVDRGRFNVTGTTTVAGTLNITSTAGAKNLNDFIITSTGVFNCTVAETWRFDGNVQVDGVFNANVAVYRFAGTNKTISGTTPIVIDDIRVTGSYTNNATVTTTTSLYGTGTWAQGSTGVLNLPITNVNFTVSVFNSSTAGNLVNYSLAGNQNIRIPDDGAYFHLTCSGSGTKSTIGVTTVNGNLNVNAGSVLDVTNSNFANNGATSRAMISGTIIMSSMTGTKTFRDVALLSGGVWHNTASETITINGNFSTTAATVTGSSIGTFNVAGNDTVYAGTSTLGTSTWNVTGSTFVNGQLNISSVSGTKTLNNLTVNGNWNNVSNEDFTITGNLDVNGTFTSGTGVYSLTGAAKTITGTVSFTIQNVNTTGTYTNFANLTVTAVLGSSAGTITQGSTGILNIAVINPNFTLGTFNASAVGNTVNYTLAGVQNVRIPNDGAYYHLGIRGSGTKSLVGTTNINGNLDITSTLDVTASNFAINLAGNWTSTGMFIPRNGTVTLNGTGTQLITRAGGETFYNLVCAGSGTKSPANPITTLNNFIINPGSTYDVTGSNFLLTVQKNWTNDGTFMPRTGTVTFNGTTAQTIGGATLTTFYNITSGNTAGVSLIAAQNLQGTLTISSGTFTTTGQTFTLLSNPTGTARIAAIPGGANIIGNITMQRYITGATSWRFLSSPVSGQTLANWFDDFPMMGFTGVFNPTNPFCSVYTYDETKPFVKDTGWVKATNVTNGISGNKGFLCYVGPNPITVDVTGAPRKFSIAMPLDYMPNNTASEIGWNLVQNPYPSSVDWDGVGWTKTNLNDAVYVWNPALQQYASYVAGVGTNGGSNIIPSSQSFFVQANAGGPALTFTENVKSGTDQPFIRIMQSQMAYYNVTLDIFGNNNQDQTIIRFDPNATNNFDGNLDAYKLAGGPGTPYIASVMDSGDYSINSIPLPAVAISIPVRVKVPATGSYTITKNTLSNIPSSCCLLLEDLLTGAITDLRNFTSYTFTIADTTNAPRFLIHVSPPIQVQSFGVLCYGDANGYAVASGNGSGPFTYVWKDSTGNILQTTSNVTSPDTLFNLPSGFYTVEVSDVNSICGTVSDSFTISQPLPVAGNIIPSSVSCGSSNDGSVLLQVSGGTVPYTYSWSHGSTAQNPSSLTAGTYSVLITDANGCTGIASAVVNQVPQVAAAFAASNDTTDLLIPLGYVSFTNTSSGASYYQWDFGDGSPIDTNANTIHYYQTTGIFTVTLISSNGTCSDTVTFAVTVLSVPFGTGMNESSLSQFITVTSENDLILLDFDLPASTAVRISIVNVLGQSVFEQAATAHKNRVRIPFEAAGGIYFVTVSTNEELFVKKIGK